MLCQKMFFRKTKHNKVNYMALTKHAVSIHQQGGSKELPDGIKTTDEDAAKVSLMILFDVLVGRFYSIGQYL